MGAVTIQQMADRVAGLLEQRLGVRGNGLAEKLKKGGRRLPRKVRGAADYLAEAAHMSQNPKLLLQVDENRVAEAYDICLKHLGGIDRGAARSGLWSGIWSSILLSLLAVALLVAGVLVWRGYL
jgi:hypothetical protein